MIFNRLVLLLILIFLLPTDLRAEGNLVVVVINPRLFSSIQPALERFQNDLCKDGYDVKIWHEEIKGADFLRAKLKKELSYGLVGAIFIGNLPSVWFEVSRFRFSCDMYFMDLDGFWIDENKNGVFDKHSGDIKPEIWVSRVDASNLSGNEAELVNNYFFKNHLYRIGRFSLPKKALTYVIPNASSRDTAGLEELYENTQIDCVTSLEGREIFDEQTKKNILKDYETSNTVLIKSEDAKNEYVNRLKKGYEWITIWVHSNSSRHNFGQGGLLWGKEIKEIDPKCYFFNLDCCYGCQFLERDYLGGWYLFSKSYTLLVIGKTSEAGCCITDKYFFDWLNKGSSIGAAVKKYFEKHVKAAPFFQQYQLVLLGDGTLRIK